MPRIQPVAQPGLFDSGPPGLSFREDFITPDEERLLVARIETLSFEPFQFHGWEGKRETVSFGWRYDFSAARIDRAPPIPDFLLPLRASAAGFAGLVEDALEQALVIRYDKGAGIGWHRDRPVFDKVVGVSLRAATVLRFRRREGARFARMNVPIAPRSAYLLDGPARALWEHSLPEAKAHRFSITFRNLRARA
jgi:alkylated DNA repair dioxygenase AlkB